MTATVIWRRSGSTSYDGVAGASGPRAMGGVIGTLGLNELWVAKPESGDTKYYPTEQNHERRTTLLVPRVVREGVNRLGDRTRRTTMLVPSAVDPGGRISLLLGLTAQGPSTVSNSLCLPELA